VQTDDQVVAAELEKVVSKLETLYDIDDEFYSSVEKAPVEVKSNRDMRIPLKLRPGGYFGYFDPANGDLGTGSSTSYDKGVISTSHMKIAIQWDLKSQWGTDDKRKALINNVKENLADAMAEFRRQSDAQCMTDGTGVIATITSVATTSGNDTYTCTTDGYRVKLLRPGQRVSVYNAARTTNRTPTPLVITSVNISANTVTMTGAATGAIATDVILPEGLTGSTPVGMYGVPYHQSDSTSGSWLGLTRSSTPEVVASSVDANSASLSLPFARLAVNKIADRIGIKNGFKPVAWMHLAQVQAYEELGQLVSIIQKSSSGKENLDLYFGGNMQLAGASIKPSMLWDKKRIDFLIMELYGRAELAPIQFHQLNGQKIFEMRGPSGGVATSFVSYILASWNLFTRNPAAGSYIKALAIPSGY
jgi:hypothetical protein